MQTKLTPEQLKDYTERFKKLVRSSRNTRHMRKGTKWIQVPLNLTLEEYITTVHNVLCFYCNGELSKTGHNLDRIIPSVGYTKGNVVPCCKWCNKAKIDLPVGDFVSWTINLQDNLSRVEEEFKAWVKGSTESEASSWRN